MCRSGPSPRPWGRAHSPRRWPLGPWTIPTPVGKSEEQRTMTVICTDHPHARGEEAHTSYGSNPTRGPSPRPWGRGLSLIRCAVQNRTIPTPVGKSSTSPTTWPSRADHPHARGEEAFLAFLALGPSPRPWGRGSTSRPERISLRTIPTPVGKRAGEDYKEKGRADHPHARGEEVLTCAARRLLIGPSPRPWGRGTQSCLAMGAMGTIPTPVGKSPDPWNCRR